MTVKPKPDGYHNVTPYLICEDAHATIAFLASAYGGTVRSQHEAPDGKLGHCEVEVGDSVIMLASACEKAAANSSMLYVYVDDVDATYERAVKAGATSVQAPTTAFYGDRTAAVTGPSGHQWWMATHVEDVSPEELERRAAEQAKQATDASA